MQSFLRGIRALAPIVEQEALVFRSFTTKASETKGVSVPSAYNIFFGEQMKLFKDGKRAGASWKTLSEAERQAYKERSSAIRKELEAKFPNGLPKQKRRSIYDSGGIPRTGLNLYIQREMAKLKEQNVSFVGSGGLAPAFLADMVKRWKTLPSSEKEVYIKEVEDLKNKLRPEYEEKARLRKAEERRKKKEAAAKEKEAAQAAEK